MNKLIKIMVLLFLIGLANACSKTGGEEGSATGLAQAKVTVTMADDLSNDYQELWLTVNSIDAMDAEGNTYSLFSSNDGELVNVLELGSLGTLLSTQDLPVGEYTNFQIQFGKSISVVTVDGDSHIYTLKTPGDHGENVNVVMQGSISVETGDVTSVTFAFDLEEMSHQKHEASPKVVLFEHHNGRGHKDHMHHAKLRGAVVGVMDNGFTLLNDKDNTEYAVSYDPQTVRLIDGLVLADIVEGAVLMVHGELTPDSLNVSANMIKAHVSDDAEDHDEGDEQEFSEASGIITAIDESQISMTVTKSEHMPVVEEIVVISNDGTLFVKGTSQDLAIDQEIKVKGLLNDDGQLVAKMIMFKIHQNEHAHHGVAAMHHDHSNE